MRPGDPAGHGHYASLDTDAEGRVICHECGAGFHQLATHLRLAHHLSAAEYRERYGLGARTRLVSAQASQAMSRAWHASPDSHIAALDEHRDPEKARQASLRRSRWAPETLAKRKAAGRATRGRELTPTETADLAACEYDLQAWADAARTILADPAVSTRSLADACGIAPATVTQRLRRYPPRT